MHVEETVASIDRDGRPWHRRRRARMVSLGTTTRLPFGRISGTVVLAAATAIVVSLISASVALWQSRKASHDAIRQADAAAQLAKDTGERTAQLARQTADLENRYLGLTRLSRAVGTLRLELVLSTRSVIRRVSTYAAHPHPLHAFKRHGHDSEYHDGGLMIYRLLRPLAVSDLIERNLYFGDLTLDATSTDLLRFNHAAVEMLCGRQIGSSADHRFLQDDGLDLEGESFDMQSCHGARKVAGRANPSAPYQRLRASLLKRAAGALIVGEGEHQRCMRHAEFLARWEHPRRYMDWHDQLRPVKETIDRFDATDEWDHEVFWLRLVGYAFVCKWFFDRQLPPSRVDGRSGDTASISVPADAFAEVPLSVVGMIEKSPTLRDNASRYPSRLQKIIDHAL